jgi:predicted PilT family ATPase
MMKQFQIVSKLINLAEQIEVEFNGKVKVGMSEKEVFAAVAEIEDFPADEMQHVIINIFTWGKPLEEGSLNTLRNEYFTILKRELAIAVQTQILEETWG